MSPLSSHWHSTYLPCRPDSVAPCWSLLADLLNARADRNQVSGWSFAKIRPLVQVNADDKMLERLIHFAYSFQRLSRRLSLLMLTHAPCGCSPGSPWQSRNQSPHQ